MLNEVIVSEDVEDEGDDNEKVPEDTKKPLSDFDALKSGLLDPKGKEEDENGEIIKNADAVDYSDITELSEDCPKTPPLETDEKKESAANDIQDLEEAIPASTVQAGIGSTSSTNKDDKELMPPPSVPVRNQNNTQEVNGKNLSDSGSETDTKQEKGKFKYRISQYELVNVLFHLSFILFDSISIISSPFKIEVPLTCLIHFKSIWSLSIKMNS